MKKGLAFISGLMLASVAITLFALTSSSAAEKDCLPGPNKDLSGCNFSLQDLTDANLSRSNLSDANLTGAILERANLEYTNLDGATLHNAYLVDAVVQRASAIGADFSGSTMHYSYLALSNLTGANLTNVQADGVYALRANFTDADFSGSLLTQWMLEGSNLTNSDLGGANLSDAYLVDTTLTGVKSGDVTISINNGGNPTILPLGWTVKGGYLIGPGANLSHAELTGLNLNGSNLTGANLSYSELGGGNLTGANLTGANLTGANLTGANLTDVNIEGADLFDAVFDVRITSARITGHPTRLTQGWVLQNGQLLKVQEPNSVSIDLLGGIFKTGEDVWANFSYPQGSTYAVKWLRNGSPIESATLVQYKITGLDFNQAISFEVTVSQPGYTTVRKTSTATVVQIGELSAIPQPLINGETKVGEVLGACFDTQCLQWDVEPTSIVYQWFSDGEAIAGATKSTYKVSSQDLGKSLSVNGSASFLGYRSQTASSEQSAPIEHGTLTQLSNLQFSSSEQPSVGQKLTAILIDWDEGVTFSFQWLRNGLQITGAKGADYEVQTEDYNSWLSVRVTGVKEGYLELTREKSLGQVSLGSIVLAAKPTLSGTGKVDQTLTATPGIWDSGVSLSYQWLRDGVAITSATTTTYALTPEDSGKQISVQLTGTKTGYATVKKTSTAIKIEAGNQTLTPTPTLSGTGKVDQTLTATPGTWDNGVNLTYQWLRDGAAITGANKDSFLLSTGDSGKQLSVEVTGTKTGYATVKKTSTAIKIEAGNQTLTPTPTLSGTGKVDQTLTATPGTWDNGVNLTYQWSRDGLSITSATKTTYTITLEDFGKKITFTVNGTKPGYVTVSKESSKATVSAGSLTSTTPKITGTAKTVSVLKATTSAWTKGAKITYQWLANGVAIKGATSSSLKLASSHKGKKISVKVTQSALGYTTASKTSASVTVK